MNLHGFYTEEVREESADKSGRGIRLGFDVVTFNGQRGPLARVERSGSPFIGYCIKLINGREPEWEKNMWSRLKSTEMF